MKDVIGYGVATLIVVAIIGAIMFGMRAFSSAVTTIVIEEVKPGVECAKIVTSDGAALDCWKVEVKQEKKEK